jgi:hypothetical protein
MCNISYEFDPPALVLTRESHKEVLLINGISSFFCAFDPEYAL